MRSLGRRILVVVRAAVLGVLIALVGQGLWTALLVTNLLTTPTVPWAVAVMAFLLWLMWQYLGGRWWPAGTAPARARLLRANRLPRSVFAWAIVAGGLSMAALAGYWVVMAQCVRLPVSAIPDMSEYPWLTMVLFGVMGSLVSPVLEQAGFWGYCQGILEREFSGLTAIMICPVLFALLPHPPPGMILAPKLLFYFLTGATFSVLAYLTNSILPGIVVHSVGLLSFFVLVFPYDTTRPLVGEGGADVWFWTHVVQAIVCAALALAALVRLARICSASGRLSSHSRKGSLMTDQGLPR